MPSFFTFQQGAEPLANDASDSAPLLGRFRAVPDVQRHGRRSHRNSILNRLSGAGIYGSFGSIGDGSSDGEAIEGDDGLRWFRRWARALKDLYIEPKQSAVAKVVNVWWSRWLVLIVLPAALAVAWCALPFPKYPLPDDDDDLDVFRSQSTLGHKVPGHGAARVEVNFWFFLFVYYGFYNLTALMWITKVFNIYSLNWWPQSVGFPVTVSIIAIISIAGPIPIYYNPTSYDLTQHNTLWILWTFITMAMPLLLALAILLNHERHLSLRHSLSETQRIFTSSWWTGENDTISGRTPASRPSAQNAFNPNAPLEVALATDDYRSRHINASLRKRWLPSSFVRFLWFCTALAIAMAAYVTGEVYAEIYLRTLPHDTVETIVYVYSWVITVHLLDALTGWILGGKEGQRVGSYPLGWIFKLYFSLTYQTYVRALYARLRSPKQFIYLQAISSTSLILLAPLTISAPFHNILTILSINGQSYRAYQKFCARNILIRGFAENVSMLTFLGSILVLHYGSNKDVYPYFAFDQDEAGNSLSNATLPISSGEGYDFGLTFYASIVTWACEIVAGWVTRRILWYGWRVDVTGEGKRDMKQWPELLPTATVVMVHVAQNMLFEIVRLRFH
ncbi:hypothetical protein BP6252_03752 [Coleophoma cylindrospora]|uniref:Uncharacterized protein n=1 Tax=Coleophoma cylindrospora TaxID=1849047 RepID=A0A3D8S8S4_9HELO|nr:hypothetical protein BP6252_03752 [Coleophoma cylindrospora]